MLKRAARAIYPGAAVPLRGRFPTDGGARRQARNERAGSARLDSQRGRWCPRRGWRDRAATDIVRGAVQTSILLLIKKAVPNPLLVARVMGTASFFSG